MAYKIVDGETLDAGLTQVADAIRAKAGTAEALAFPDGMAEAVANFSALNFSVVGGTTQPASPTENTIWVNTDQAITDWILSPDQPESPTEGMVWVQTNGLSRRRFNVLTGETIVVCIAYAHQYLSGAWVQKESQLYRDGQWLTEVTWLYKPGDGGTEWASAGARTHASSTVWNPLAPTVNFATEHMHISYSATQKLRQGIVYRPDPIDLTNYSSITATFSRVFFDGSYYGTGFYLVILSGLDFDLGTSALQIADFTIRSGTGGCDEENVTVSGTIADVSGEGYVGIRLGAAGDATHNVGMDAYLTELYLE